MFLHVRRETSYYSFALEQNCDGRNLVLIDLISANPASRAWSFCEKSAFSQSAPILSSQIGNGPFLKTTTDSFLFFSPARTHFVLFFLFKLFDAARTFLGFEGALLGKHGFCSRRAFS